MLLQVRNAAVEAENKIITIKAAVKIEGGGLHHRTLMSTPMGSPSIKMTGLISSFQYEESNYKVAETMKEYELASTEADYENPGEQAPMGFMVLCEEIQGPENSPTWMEWKRSSLPSLTGTKNTNWETAALHTSAAKEFIIEASGRFNTPVEYIVCTNYPIYHAKRFHTYRN